MHDICGELVGSFAIIPHLLIVIAYTLPLNQSVFTLWPMQGIQNNLTIPNHLNTIFNCGIHQ